MKKYKISVIIPVYKVEKYLEETILSVVNQTIGFENIQMILVNDGSPDNSEEICLKYKDMYPDNVVYVKQENSGVSAARNNGLKHATGEFVNFLDSDDKHSANAYKVGYEMLKDNNLDIVSFRIMFFDARKGPHNLDFKFKKGDRIIDLTKEPYNPLYHVSSALIRRSLIEGIEFDTRLKISEDLKYLSDVLVKAKRIGVIASECFYYRRRCEETSAIQTSTKKPTFYLDTPRYCYEYVLDLGKKHKDMDNYCQFIIVYDLMWRTFNINTSILSDEEKQNYKEKIRELFNRCDDEVICSQSTREKSIIFKELMFKYNTIIDEALTVKDNYLYFKDVKICNVKDIEFNIYNIEVVKDTLKLNALFDWALNTEINFYVKIDNKYVKFDKQYVSEKTNNLYSDDYDYKDVFYNIELDLKGLERIEFYVEIKNKKYKINPIYSRFSRLNSLESSCFKHGKYKLSRDESSILVNKTNAFSGIKYMFDVLFKAKDILSFGMIFIYFITKPFTKKDNWIISDRYDVAGDNGEWMFRYIKENTHKSNVYFAIKRGSRDAQRMRQYGKVIYFNSFNYYLKYLNSELVISSHIDNFIHKPFGRKQIYLNPFIKRKYVFLQHGIIKEDLSVWLNKYKQNISMFVTSTNAEYNSILNEAYMYDESIVKLTGLPRYDNLLNNDIRLENLILLAPTWRTQIVGTLIPGTQNREYNYGFKETEYFKFYNNLINDKRLLKALKSKKYKILFCLHPSMKGQIDDFDKNDYVDIKCQVDYPTLFKRAKLMITDYSSVFFDFAYLKKPVIYCHFDKSNIKEIHKIYRDGYFDYEKEGLGDVVYDYETTIEEIIKSIKNDCKMEDKYLKRVNKTFKYFDDNNSKRVYDGILEILDIDK